MEKVKDLFLYVVRFIWSITEIILLLWILVLIRAGMVLYEFLEHPYERPRIPEWVFQWGTVCMTIFVVMLALTFYIAWIIADISRKIFVQLEPKKQLS